jgi:DNA-binding FadR family transcriptional regulator
MIVEPAAAALAAERRDEPQLERMRRALIQMQHETPGHRGRSGRRPRLP